MRMSSMQISEIIVGTVSALISAGIIGIFAQGRGLFKRFSAMERTVQTLVVTVDELIGEFKSSHAMFDDGEVHHRRSRRG